MEKIRVLDIMPYIIIPPISGGALRIIRPLTRIKEEDNLTVDVLVTADAERIKKAKEYLGRYPGIGRVVGVEASINLSSEIGRPDYLSEDVWNTMCLELLEEAVKMANETHYDIIQIEHSYLAWIVPLLRKWVPKTTYVLDLHNAEYRVYEKWLTYASEEDNEKIRRKYEKLYQWEMMSWKWFDAALTVSSVESELFTMATGCSNVFEVPTGGGIEIEEYLPSDEQRQKPYDLLYLGTMEWFPNAQGLIWFVKEVLPYILEKEPKIKLNIVGFGNPNSELVSLAKKHKNIVFWGEQADDKKFFHGSKVFVVPLFIGAGARVKVPTAWASRIPIVCTNFAPEGLHAVNGKNISMSDDPREFADLVLRTLNDSEYAGRIVEEAHKTAREEYSVNACVEKLVHIYHKLAEK